MFLSSTLGGILPFVCAGEEQEGRNVPDSDRVVRLGIVILTDLFSSGLEAIARDVWKDLALDVNVDKDVPDEAVLGKDGGFGDLRHLRGRYSFGSAGTGGHITGSSVHIGSGFGAYCT